MLTDEQRKWVADRVRFYRQYVAGEPTAFVDRPDDDVLAAMYDQLDQAERDLAAARAEAEAAKREAALLETVVQTNKALAEEAWRMHEEQRALAEEAIAALQSIKDYLGAGWAGKDKGSLAAAHVWGMSADALRALLASPDGAAALERRKAERAVIEAATKWLAHERERRKCLTPEGGMTYEGLQRLAELRTESTARELALEAAVDALAAEREGDRG